FGGVNVFRMVTDGGSTSAVGSYAIAWSARVNVSSDVSKALTVQGAYFYRGPMKIERGRFEAMHWMTLSVRRKLDGDKASMTLRLSDPFKTSTFRIRAGDTKVVQVTERNFGMRMVWLAFQYNYGRPPRVRQPRQEEGSGSAFGPQPPT